MGGGDLNLKKSWHPLTVRNREKVWKLEQEQLEKDKKAELFQKELRRERQVQELKRLQTGGSGIPAEKMDWMYAGSTQRSMSFQEDFLLGRKKVDELLEQPPAAEGHAATFPPFPQAVSPSFVAQKDLEAKVREDPLFAIKRREQESIAEMAKNPLIRRRVAQSSSSARRNEWSSHSNPRSTPLRTSSSKIAPTWSMSEEERTSKLAAMQTDAQNHSSQRKERVLSSREEEKTENDQAKESFKARDSQRDFLTGVKESAYSTRSSREDLHSRLSATARRKHSHPDDF